MDFQYERASIPGVPDSAFNEFYTYVDIILDMLVRERLNPYTNELYCLCEDATFEMLPVEERIQLNMESGYRRELNHKCRVKFSLPFRERIDNEIQQKYPIYLQVILAICFDDDDNFLDNNYFWVFYSPQIYNAEHKDYYMITRDQRDSNEIRDTLRIFLASTQNLYNCALDGSSQRRRRSRIVDDYIRRHNKYIGYISNEYLSDSPKLVPFFGKYGPVNHYPYDMTQLLKKVFVEEHKDLMRDVTSQGVDRLPQ